jgi:hypothetical protein
MRVRSAAICLSFVCALFSTLTMAQSEPVKAAASADAPAQADPAKRQLSLRRPGTRPDTEIPAEPTVGTYDQIISGDEGSMISLMGAPGIALQTGSARPSVWAALGSSTGTFGIGLSSTSLFSVRGDGLISLGDGSWSGVIQATAARPAIAFLTGNSLASSSFTIGNSSHAELLTVSSAGPIGIGASPLADKVRINMGTSTTPIALKFGSTATGGPSTVPYTFTGGSFASNDLLMGTVNDAVSNGAQHFISFGSRADSGARTFSIGSASDANFNGSTVYKPGLTVRSDGSASISGDLTVAADKTYTIKARFIGAGYAQINQTLNAWRAPSDGTWHLDDTALSGWIQAIDSDFHANFPDAADHYVISRLTPGSGARTVVPLLTLNARGDLTTAGSIGATYQDVAEWVPSSHELQPGDVVVVDPATRNGVGLSSRAYDTTVAGVVSLHPGLILGVAGEGKEQIATTGRVKVKVDAGKSGIRPGDLLVTSDRPGVAMKSVPVDLNGIAIHRPGTIIGKALEPLAEGEGEILVLLSLQ